MGKDRVANDSCAPISTQVLDASPPTHKTPPTAAMNTRQLLRYPRSGDDWTEVRIELFRRFALPVACIALALVGIPLASPRAKAARAPATSSHYFSASSATTFLAHADRVCQAENHVGAAGGVAARRGVSRGWGDLSVPHERPGDRDLLGGVTGLLSRMGSWLRRNKPQPAAPVAACRTGGFRPAADRRHLYPDQLHVLSRRGTGQPVIDDFGL